MDFFPVHPSHLLLVAATVHSKVNLLRRHLQVTAARLASSVRFGDLNLNYVFLFLINVSIRFNSLTYLNLT